MHNFSCITAIKDLNKYLILCKIKLLAYNKHSIGSARTCYCRLLTVLVRHDGPTTGSESWSLAVSHIISTFKLKVRAFPIDNFKNIGINITELYMQNNYIIIATSKTLNFSQIRINQMATVSHIIADSALSNSQDESEIDIL